MSAPGRFSKRSAFPFPLSMRASFSLTACGTSSELMFECLHRALVRRFHQSPSPIETHRSTCFSKSLILHERPSQPMLPIMNEGVKRERLAYGPAGAEDEAEAQAKLLEQWKHKQ